ncbi:MAG: sigma-70 family RNA polymerase sigma factor [Acidobacteriota bacterium]|nr:sigma-70 family RNA polymerase sigma factor [Acidobacteriota bacterium]
MKQEPVTPVLQELFEAHHGLVFRTAYRITGNAADAEDVLQTVFLRLLRRDQGGALLQQESYLRRAAVNVALDLVRTGKDSKTIPIDDLPSGRSLASAPRRTEPESRELHGQLRRALATLPPREAEIFALRFFEERSNQEIAALLGISQVHVAVILHRTRRQLQKEINSYSGDKA